MATANGSTPPAVRGRLQGLPTFMQRQILAFVGYKEYTLAARTCHTLQTRWTEALANRQMSGTLFFPGSDCTTLQQAVDKVAEDHRLTTIVLVMGQYWPGCWIDVVVEGSYVEVSSAMNIVGDPSVPRNDLVVEGGITFKKGIQGNCHLQHLTLRGAKHIGVWGRSSFTMEDVLVEQCCVRGVVAKGFGVVGRCTNVEVRQCGGSGVVAHTGASITLIGDRTTVHHNCTVKRRSGCGLLVCSSSSSTIQLVAPLTKEHVSIDNGGCGNWGHSGPRNRGDIHQIKTIGSPASPPSSNGCICF